MTKREKPAILLLLFIVFGGMTTISRCMDCLIEKNRPKIYKEISFENKQDENTPVVVVFHIKEADFIYALWQDFPKNELEDCDISNDDPITGMLRIKDIKKLLTEDKTKICLNNTSYHIRKLNIEKLSFSRDGIEIEETIKDPEIYMIDEPVACEKIEGYGNHPIIESNKLHGLVAGELKKQDQNIDYALTDPRAAGCALQRTKFGHWYKTVYSLFKSKELNKEFFPQKTVPEKNEFDIPREYLKTHEATKISWPLKIMSIIGGAALAITANYIIIKKNPYLTLPLAVGSLIATALYLWKK